MIIRYGQQAHPGAMQMDAYGQMPMHPDQYGQGPYSQDPYGQAPYGSQSQSQLHPSMSQPQMNMPGYSPHPQQQQYMSMPNNMSHYGDYGGAMSQPSPNHMGHYTAQSQPVHPNQYGAHNFSQQSMPYSQGSQPASTFFFLRKY